MAHICQIKFSNAFGLNEYLFNKLLLQYVCTNLVYKTINIDSGYGLVSPGNKPLPEPILTPFYDAIWHDQATIC